MLWIQTPDSLWILVGLMERHRWETSSNQMFDVQEILAHYSKTLSPPSRPPQWVWTARDPQNLKRRVRIRALFFLALPAAASSAEDPPPPPPPLPRLLSDQRAGRGGVPAGSFAALSKLFIINSQDYKVQHLNASCCLWVPQRPKGASMFILQVGGSQPQAPLWTHKRDRAPARSPPAPPPPHGSQPGCCKENWHPPMLKFTHMVGGHTWTKETSDSEKTNRMWTWSQNKTTDDLMSMVPRVMVGLWYSLNLYF